MKRLRKLLGLALAGTIIGALLERLLIAAPPYRGPRSDHFDGERFHNQDPAPHSQGSFFKWMMNRERGPWRKWTDAPPGPPPPERVADGLRITFINHATTLIQMDGVNILTDPIWSDRAFPLRRIGPKRHRPPGIRFDDLPPIDLVLVSHNHYDHLDLPTLERLAARNAPRIAVPLGTSALLARNEIGRAEELDWWESRPVRGPVSVTLVPAQHFSARGFSDRNRNLWGGWVVTGPSGSVYFAGDTGWGPHFAEIRERLGPIRLALIPIGAFRPRWFMKPVHLGPDEAVRAHDVLAAGTSVAIHHGTFALGDDGETEPVTELKKALADGKERRFWTLGFGEGRDVPF